MQSISTGLLYFFALGVASYAAYVYGFLPLGSLAHPEMKAAFLAHSYGIYIHVFASIVALARISHSPSTATAQLHTMTRFHSVQALDIVSVVKTSHSMPLNRLVTKCCEKSGLVLGPF